MYETAVTPVNEIEQNLSDVVYTDEASSVAGGGETIPWRGAILNKIKIQEVNDLAQNLFEKALQGEQLPENISVTLVEEVQAENILPATVPEIPTFAHTLRILPSGVSVERLGVAERKEFRTPAEDAYFKDRLATARESTLQRRGMIEDLLQEPGRLAEIVPEIRSFLTPEQYIEFTDGLNRSINMMLPRNLRQRAGLTSLAEVLTQSKDKLSHRQEWQKQNLVSLIDQTGHVNPDIYNIYDRTRNITDIDVEENITRAFGAGVAELGSVLQHAAETARYNILVASPELANTKGIKGAQNVDTILERVEGMDKMTKLARTFMLRGEVFMTLARDITEDKVEHIQREIVAKERNNISAEVVTKDEAIARIDFARSVGRGLLKTEVLTAFVETATHPELLKEKKGLLAKGDELLGYNPRELYELAHEVSRYRMHELVRTAMVSEYISDGKSPAELTDAVVDERVSRYDNENYLGKIEDQTDSVLILYRAMRLGSDLPRTAQDRVCATLIAANYLNRLPPHILPQGDYADITALLQLRGLVGDMRDVPEVQIAKNKFPPELLNRFNNTIPSAITSMLTINAEISANDLSTQPSKLLENGAPPKRITGNLLDPALIL